MVFTYGAAYAVNQKHTPKQIFYLQYCSTLTHAATIMSLLRSYVLNVFLLPFSKDPQTKGYSTLHSNTQTLKHSSLHHSNTFHSTTLTLHHSNTLHSTTLHSNTLPRFTFPFFVQKKSNLLIRYHLFFTIFVRVACIFTIQK
jgi:hypothetical protein